MNKTEVIQTIKDIGVIPVVRASSEKEAILAVEAIKAAGLPILEITMTVPGALTPTEIVLAWNAGADLVKVFPAGAMGGASYIKSLKAPFPQIELVPTGGVTLANVAGFIEAGAVAVGVGTDLVDTRAIRSGHPEKITQAARAFIEAVRRARGDVSAVSVPIGT